MIGVSRGAGDDARVCGAQPDSAAPRAARADAARDRTPTLLIGTRSRSWRICSTGSATPSQASMLGVVGIVALLIWLKRAWLAALVGVVVLHAGRDRRGMFRRGTPVLDLVDRRRHHHDLHRDDHRASACSPRCAALATPLHPAAGAADARALVVARLDRSAVPGPRRRRRVRGGVYRAQGTVDQSVSSSAVASQRVTRATSNAGREQLVLRNCERWNLAAGSWNLATDTSHFSRRRTCRRIGVPMKPNDSRSWLTRNRS